MKDLEDNINNQLDQIIEIETGQETFLETHRIETEEQHEDPIGPEINLGTIQKIYQIIGQEIVEMTLNKNPINIVNIVIKMVILGNTAGRCKPICRKQKGLRRYMIEMITHLTHSNLW